MSTRHSWRPSKVPSIPGPRSANISPPRDAPGPRSLLAPVPGRSPRSEAPLSLPGLAAIYVVLAGLVLASFTVEPTPRVTVSVAAVDTERALPLGRHRTPPNVEPTTQVTVIDQPSDLVAEPFAPGAAELWMLELIDASREKEGLVALVMD